MEGDQYEVVIALNFIGAQLKRIADMTADFYDIKPIGTAELGETVSE